MIKLYFISGNTHAIAVLANSLHNACQCFLTLFPYEVVMAVGISKEGAHSLLACHISQNSKTDLLSPENAQ